ncbi:hypothetical protein [Microscilla marina]|uniref:Uncharacterized protein n=1 Tax=Microscilla marina ATCC 23134 TaxID=313606 RepID=A1ZY84_MICM2|nr:hypothetical protein [Microscilla marina]EAY24650.1 hypothetical protein M23134_00602 [Microscilla marina ATCC 23134]
MSFKKLKNNIHSNIDVYISMLAGFVAVLYGLLGGSEIKDSIILATIAAILGIIAFGILKDRHTREQLLSEVKNLNIKSSSHFQLYRRNSYKPLSETLKNAKEIIFIGVSLNNILNNVGESLKKKVQEQNLNVTLIYLDQNVKSFGASAFWLNETTSSLKDHIKFTDKKLKDLGNHGFNVKKIEALPGYSMLLIDPNKENAKIFVEFHTFQALLDERPHVVLNKPENPLWFEYFKHQYEKISDKAKQV